VLKWKKVWIGAFLFAGFVFYTQYEKNAEPAWKVNEKEFTVVDTLKEGMKREYRKYENLEMVDYYGLLTELNKSVPLKEEYRILHIEKIWNIEGRLYFLYSVDLKERDKNERDVPRISVKKIKLSANSGKEMVFSASENHGNPGTRDEGFVYKHKLYRSMMVMPIINNYKEIDWKLFKDINRIELQKLEVSDKEGVAPIENIAFKVSSENLYFKVLDSSSINKKFTYGDNKTAKLKSYDVLLYDRRFSLILHEDDNDLVGFSGYLNDENRTYSWDVVGTKELGYFLPLYEEPIEKNNLQTERSVTFLSSIHKNNQSYSWTIPKEDISNFNNQIEKPFIKKEEIVDMDNMKIIYEGLTKFNGGATIKISIIPNSNLDRNNFNLFAESYYGSNTIPEEYERSYKRNLITITNDMKEKFGNFDILNEASDSKLIYYITFYKEDINDGPRNLIPIPEENLTITISDLLYSKPLSSSVTFKYKVPVMKKSNK
jgi:hypothetical protein